MLRIEVQVAPPFAAHVDAGRVREVVREVLSQESDRVHSKLPSREPERPGELTVVISDEETVKELNNRFREVNSSTDVLAFGGMVETFIEAPEATPYLGDVVISYPHVHAQAGEQGHPPERELALLVSHGVLHLLGYDHGTPQEQAIMWAHQEAILKRLGY